MWQPSHTVRQKIIPHFVPGVRMCAQMLSRRNKKLKLKKKVKSVADMLASTRCAALTRSRLVRQVSSVLPFTAGKMGMAPWANLRGSFTTRDNVHVACLHHSHLSFPRHSKETLAPSHASRKKWKTMTRQNRHTTSLFHEWRGENRREDWTARSTQLTFSNNVTPHETATEKQQ